jgi:Leucine-rich repeat (LRR) protein
MCILFVFCSTLSNNSLQDIPPGSFTVNNGGLVVLDLSHNHIPAITDDVFAHLTFLQQL